MTTWVTHREVSPDGAQSRAGTVANSEPLTFHEPCDSCFGEKQHPIINVMQQVMQRETVDAEDRVQSVKTWTRDQEGKQGQPASQSSRGSKFSDVNKALSSVLWHLESNKSCLKTRSKSPALCYHE